MITKIPQLISCMIYVIMSQPGSGGAHPAARSPHVPFNFTALSR
jgi:hypothetical protein